MARVLYRTTSEGGRQGTDNVNPHLPPQHETSDSALRHPTAIIQLLQKIYSPLFVFQNQAFGKKNIVPTYLRNFVQYKHPVYTRITRNTTKKQQAQSISPEEQGFFFEPDDPRNQKEARISTQEPVDQPEQGPGDQEGLRYGVNDLSLYGLGANQQQDYDEDEENPDGEEPPEGEDQPGNPSDASPPPIDVAYYHIYVRHDENYSDDGKSQQQTQKGQLVDGEDEVLIAGYSTTRQSAEARSNPTSVAGLLEMTTIYGGRVCVDQQDYERTATIPTRRLTQREKGQHCFNSKLITFWQELLMKESPGNYFCLDPCLAFDQSTHDAKVLVPSTFWNLDGLFFPQQVGGNWKLYLIRPKTKNILVLGSLDDKLPQLPPVLVPLLNRIEADSRFFFPYANCCDQWKPVSLKLGGLQKKTDSMNSGVYVLAFLETLLPVLQGYPDAQSLQEILLTRFKNEPSLVTDTRYKIRLMLELLCSAFTTTKFVPADFQNWQPLNEGAHKIFFRDDFFRYLECGGAGDCMYFSLLTALKLAVVSGDDTPYILPQALEERVARLKALDSGYLRAQGRPELVVDFRRIVGDNIQRHCEKNYRDPLQRKQILQTIEREHQGASLLPTPTTYEELAEQIRSSSHRWGDNLAIAVIANQLGLNFWLYKEYLPGSVACLHPVNSDDKSITKYMILKYRGNHYQLIGHRREDNTFQTVFDMTKPEDVLVIKKLEKVLEDYRDKEDKKRLQTANEFAQENDLAAGEACNILFNAKWDKKIALGDWRMIQQFRNQAEKKQLRHQELSYATQLNLLQSTNFNSIDLAVTRLAFYLNLMNQFKDLVPNQEDRGAIILGACRGSNWNTRTVHEFIHQTIQEQAARAQTRKRKPAGDPEDDAPITKKSKTTDQLDPVVLDGDELMPQAPESNPNENPDGPPNRQPGERRVSKRARTATTTRGRGGARGRGANAKRQKNSAS